MHFAERNGPDEGPRRKAGKRKIGQNIGVIKNF
jgi:hypothetical protein